jgi:hypothetical protein
VERRTTRQQGAENPQQLFQARILPVTCQPVKAHRNKNHTKASRICELPNKKQLPGKAHTHAAKFAVSIPNYAAKTPSEQHRQAGKRGCHHDHKQRLMILTA